MCNFLMLTKIRVFFSNFFTSRELGCAEDWTCIYLSFSANYEQYAWHYFDREQKNVLIGVNELSKKQPDPFLKLLGDRRFLQSWDAAYVPGTLTNLVKQSTDYSYRAFEKNILCCRKIILHGLNSIRKILFSVSLYLDFFHLFNSFQEEIKK